MSLLTHTPIGKRKQSKRAAITIDDDDLKNQFTRQGLDLLEAFYEQDELEGEEGQSYVLNSTSAYKASHPSVD